MRQFFKQKSLKVKKQRKKCKWCKLTIPYTISKANKIYCSPRCRHRAGYEKVLRRKKAALRRRHRLASLRDQTALLKRQTALTAKRHPLAAALLALHSMQIET